MNDLIYLRKELNGAKGQGGGGKPLLKRKNFVTSEKLQALEDNLKHVLNYWQNQKLIEMDLVAVTYNKIIAKSNRFQLLLKDGKKSPTSSIVGAKFVGDYEKHQITYYVSEQCIKEAISSLEEAREVVDVYFNGKIDYTKMLDFNSSKSKVKFEKLSKNKFGQIIVDASFAERIDIPESNADFEAGEAYIVNIYDLFKENQNQEQTIRLLKKIGINVNNDNFLNSTTFRLWGSDAIKLKQNAPYLISMGNTDLSTISVDDTENVANVSQLPKLPQAKDRPIVGVIDTNCWQEDYFGKWVEIHNDPNYSEEQSLSHGTAVTSLIVNAPALNPDLDDSCGMFRVRHFGIANEKKNSAFEIIKKIERIIQENRDIKVWNFSFGEKIAVNNNFISPIAAALDSLQTKYNDIIFILPGTNHFDKTDSKIIGAPADSINSLVVNSVDIKTKKPADYTRKGPVLSCFVKPDIAYYGGTTQNKISLIRKDGKIFQQMGTSYAAPLIARKVAYLMEVMGLSREVAKALIIDSAIKWNESPFDTEYKKGYGVVPIKIEDVLEVPNDEIRFVISGESKAYNTYTDGIPIPLKDNAFPYKARATLAYFPECDRNQGVDYTATELDLHFGRIKGNGIKTINNNKQALPEPIKESEKDARKNYRKWDNVKVIQERITDRSRAQKMYDSPMWEIELFSKERLVNYNKSKVRFAVVVTMRSIDGKNRIDSFIKQCIRRGWIVSKVNIQVQEKVNEQAETEINWDDNED